MYHPPDAYTVRVCVFVFVILQLPILHFQTRIWREMSSAFIKSRLKSARESLGNKDFAGARDATLQILEHEPQNYNACVDMSFVHVCLTEGRYVFRNVFLGLALLELGEIEKSEQVIRSPRSVMC